MIRVSFWPRFRNSRARGIVAGRAKVKAAASEERQAMVKKFEPFSTAAERGMKLIEKVDKQKRGLDFGEIASMAMLGSEFATKILIGLMAEKESDVESDADGRFKVSVDNGPGWAIAYGQRTLGKIGQTDIQNSEQYYWVVELPQKKSQLFLSSNNCDLAEAEGKLRVLSSETKTSAGGSKIGARIEDMLSASGKAQKVYAEEKSDLDRIKAEKERLAAAEVKERQSKIVTEGVNDKDGRLLVSIPGGTFEMGSSELAMAPVHSVNVTAFFIGQTEVTYGEWKSVSKWAEERGYSFENEGLVVSDKHPVTGVRWYDAVKWSNAKSEMEGLVPCYKVSGDIYRKGERDKVTCDWKSNGYRLPTEAEWEKAARGGLVGKQFPNGDTLTEKEANFAGAGTVEVGKYPANGYGLYDMAGNVMEWCWDWYDSKRLGVDDPRGPETGVYRVSRGGMWEGGAVHCSSASRNNFGPVARGNFIGFRLARGSIQTRQGVAMGERSEHPE